MIFKMLSFPLFLYFARGPPLTSILGSATDNKEGNLNSGIECKVHMLYPTWVSPHLQCVISLTSAFAIHNFELLQIGCGILN